jgi:hypothetical protein
MESQNLISTAEFCQHHNIDISFINSLQDFGLVDITIMEGSGFIQEDQLEEIEKMVRLYYDLNINFEGIDAIRHLLEHIQIMQNELTALKNRLQFYEWKE